MQLQLTPFHLLKHPVIEKRTATDLAQAVRNLLDEEELRVANETLTQLSPLLQTPSK